MPPTINWDDNDYLPVVTDVDDVRNVISDDDEYDNAGILVIH
jgi:hypothetical protein